MTDKETEISRIENVDQHGVSDDFVLPIAPLLVPLRQTPVSNRKAASKSVPSSATNATGNDPPVAFVSPPVQEPSGEDLIGNPTAPVTRQLIETSDKSAPWSLVVILICIVVGLLFTIINKPNKNLGITPSASSSGIDERELASAKSEAESMRTNVAHMEQRIGELEQQLESERKVAETRAEKLLREKQTLEVSSSSSIAEIDSLKRQLQSAAPKDPPRPAPPQAEPVVSNNNSTIYRVTGLVDGDTLNVRSGPGASNPVVIRLYNGVKLSVVGDGVTNGPDTWLPCSINKIFTEPPTGLVQTFKQEGWVNSYFIEQVPGQ
jgi:hypothetical protein